MRAKTAQLSSDAGTCEAMWTTASPPVSCSRQLVRQRQKHGRRWWLAGCNGQQAPRSSRSGVVAATRLAVSHGVRLCSNAAHSSFRLYKIQLSVTVDRMTIRPKFCPQFVNLYASIYGKKTAKIIATSSNN